MATLLADDWDEAEVRAIARQLEQAFAGQSVQPDLLAFLRQQLSDEQLYAVYGPLQAAEWGLDEPEWA